MRTALKTLDIENMPLVPFNWQLFPTNIVHQLDPINPILALEQHKYCSKHLKLFLSDDLSFPNNSTPPHINFSVPKTLQRKGKKCFHIFIFNEIPNIISQNTFKKSIISILLCSQKPYSDDSTREK